MIKAIFFDLDRTLLDFSATEKRGLQNIFHKHNIDLTPELLKWYIQHNEKLWSDYENGLIPRDVIFANRFQDTFTHFNIAADGHIFEADYRKELANGADLIENALFVVEQLSAHYPLYVMTNGLASTQAKRMLDAGLVPFFKDVFVSEDTGFQKPQKEFFDYCFARISSPLKREETIIIGDSLPSDIQGGNLAGMQTCWFHEPHVQNDTPYQPTYEITELTELLAILGLRS